MYESSFRQDEFIQRKMQRAEGEDMEDMDIQDLGIGKEEEEVGSGVVNGGVGSYPKECVFECLSIIYFLDRSIFGRRFGKRNGNRRTH